MKRNRIKTALCLLLICALALQLGGCAGGSPAGASKEPAGTGQTPPQTEAQPALQKTVNLMAEIMPRKAEAAPVDPAAAEAAADFTLRLFRAGNETDKNTLYSPLSVLCALSMTANGAKGETLTQMEKTLGLDRDRWNACFRAYMEALENDKSLKLANSVWFTADPRFTVERSFLQTNADYYGADVYQAPFDESTLAEINNWVKEKTDGMIPEILDKIPPEALMYLVNALAFDAKWTKPYTEYAVQEGEFNCADGTKRKVTLMYSEEEQYLEHEKAVGFLKPYEGGKYAFAALLPKEGVSVEELLAALDGAALYKLLTEPEYATVQAALPKFETEYGAELSETLKNMGMELPFDGFRADFSGLGISTGGNIFIGRVLHKTFLSVDEAGTRAGASTVVEMVDECAPVDLKQVILDRPFVYMLIDLETGLPFFLGTMLDPAQE